MELFEIENTYAFIIVVENLDEKTDIEIKYYDKPLQPQESVELIKGMHQHFPVKEGLCNTVTKNENVWDLDLKREQEVLSQSIIKKSNCSVGEPIYACPKCPAEFRTRRAAKGHLNAHFGIRPFQCDQCSNAYTSDTALMAHKQSHSARVFTCDYCKRSFYRKNTLIGHITTHSGKMYLCNQCGKGSHSQSALNRHLRAHTKVGQYKCIECTRVYSSLTGLNGHMKAKHGKQVLTKKMFFNTLPTMQKECSLSDLFISS